MEIIFYLQIKRNIIKYKIIPYFPLYFSKWRKMLKISHTYTYTQKHTDIYTYIYVYICITLNDTTTTIHKHLLAP